MRRTVNPARRVHILNGDGTGGGHRSGSGDPRKSKFPAAWTDQAIIDAIETVANDPASLVTKQPNARFRYEGSHGGIRIRVIVEPDDRTIWTGHPI